MNIRLTLLHQSIILCPSPFNRQQRASLLGAIREGLSSILKYSSVWSEKPNRISEDSSPYP
jgi:hypothetical protein